LAGAGRRPAALDVADRRAVRLLPGPSRPAARVVPGADGGRAGPSGRVRLHCGNDRWVFPQDLRAASRGSVLDLSVVGKLRLADAVELHELAADLLTEFFGLFAGIVLDFHLKEEIRAAHAVWSSPDFYTKGMACAICETRRPRRFCPGVRGDICSICCGTEREVTVDCPFECEYLQEARRHDKPVPLDVEHLPNRDIRITQEWVEKHSELLTFVAGAVFAGAMQTQGAIDFDVREALE